MTETQILPETTATGQVVSGYGGLVEWTDSDGEVYRETAEDRAWRAAMHREDLRQLAYLRAFERVRRGQGIHGPASRPRTPRRAASSGRPAGPPRRTRRSSGSRGDPPPDGEPPRLTFARYRRLTPGLPGHYRCRLFGKLPERFQDACWDDLARSLERWRP